MERRELEDFILWLIEESGHQICTKPDERNNHSVIPLRNPRSDPRHYPEHIAARYLQLQKKEPVTQERFRDIVEAALHIAEERTTILAELGQALLRHDDSAIKELASRLCGVPEKPQLQAEPDPDFRCTECGGAEFLEGPHGGTAVNFCCKGCWARYNDLWPFRIDRDGFVLAHEMEAFHGPYTPRKQASG